MELFNTVLGMLAEACFSAWEWLLAFDEKTMVLSCAVAFFMAFVITRFVLGPIFGFNSLSDTAIKGMKKMGVGSTSSPTPRSSTRFAGGKVANKKS